MANNPYVNKVVYGNSTVMDISDTTATEGDVISGKDFYKANGAKATGTAVIPDISNCYQTTDTAETDLVDGDYVPFYDSSATAKRKTLWSNIKAKLKSYFDGVYTTTVELTQSQYDALSSAEKHDPTKVYYITDGQGGGGGYTLPIASASELGGIKVGDGLSINSTTGVLSANVSPSNYTMKRAYGSLTTYESFTLYANHGTTPTIYPSRVRCSFNNSGPFTKDNLQSGKTIILSYYIDSPSGYHIASYGPIWNYNYIEGNNYFDVNAYFSSTTTTPDIWSYTFPSGFSSFYVTYLYKE